MFGYVLAAGRDWRNQRDRLRLASAEVRLVIKTDELLNRLSEMFSIAGEELDMYKAMREIKIRLSGVMGILRLQPACEADVRLYRGDRQVNAFTAPRLDEFMAQVPSLQVDRIEVKSSEGVWEIIKHE